MGNKHKHEMEYIVNSMIDENMTSRFQLEKMKILMTKVLEEEKEELFWKNARLEADCKELKVKNRYLKNQIFSNNIPGSINFDGLSFHINEIGYQNPKL